MLYKTVTIKYLPKTDDGPKSKKSKRNVTRSRWIWISFMPITGNTKAILVVKKI